MNVKRYFAQTAREALRALKAELGADAIVLSNRSVDGGVEILALPADAVGALQEAARPAVAPAQRPAPAPASRELPDIDDDFLVNLSAQASTRRPAPAQPVQPVRASETRRPAMAETAAQPAAAAPRAAVREPQARAAAAQPVRAFQPSRIDTADYMMRTQAEAPLGDPFADQPFALDTAEAEPTRPQPRAVRLETPAEAPARAPADANDAQIRDLQAANARLMGEIAGVRELIERQLSGFAWGETRRKAPARADIVGELLEAGFSGVLARRLAAVVGDDASAAEARAAVKAALARDLRAMSSDADIIDRGGVYALVGPTGVGKTTTTAKLAARCVVRHGADKLALITTDGYRIGAQEQLRIYGRILGVPVFSVRDGADLRQTLAELRNKHMVLIDTMGMSQRDRMVAEQVAMLTGAGNVRRLLLLNATCRGDTLADVVRAYRGPGLAGCVLTKVDEAASLAPAIDVAVSHELDVFYVANGQRVPEDLHLPNRAYLLHRALREQGAGSPWKLEGDEAALMLGSGAGA